MTPFDCYKTYLALKNHFTKEKYDYHKYCGKSRASLQSFYKRKDRFWFEKLSRNKTDKEIVDFFVSNFVSRDNPDTLWIGEIIRNGDKVYSEWKKRNQSLNYIFTEETEKLFDNQKVDDVLEKTKTQDIDVKVIIPSMERGHRTPPQAQEPRRHPPDKLVASPDAIKVGGIGLEQILIKGSLLKEKQYRFPLHCWGDGMFIVRVVQENIDNTIFCPEINVWFNYFEPGRWDK